VKLESSAIRGRLGSNCEELTQGTHFRVGPNNRNGAAERPFAFLVPQNRFGFLEIIANRRIAIAHCGPRDVCRMVDGREGRGARSWHPRRSTAADASQCGPADLRDRSPPILAPTHYHSPKVALRHGSGGACGRSCVGLARSLSSLFVVALKQSAQL
jgi:hypothetical protein